MARLVSRPTRSSRAKGPIGNPQPPRMAVSTSSMAGHPRLDQPMALFRYGKRRALTMKPAWSLTSTGSLPQDTGELPALGDRLVAGGQGPDQLDQAHDRGRVEEVDAAHPVGPPGLHGQVDDRPGWRCWWPGCVASAQMRSRSLNRCRLGGQVLDDGLEDQIAVGQLAQVGGHLDPGEGVGAQLVGELAPVDLLGQRLLQPGQHGVGRRDAPRAQHDLDGRPCSHTRRCPSP